MEKKRTYIAIDLKSFYASVECNERGLDPLKTNLVVADTSRSEKTICLAVSPSLKAYGIPGRARLFEVIQKVKEINRERSRKIRWKEFQGSSMNEDDLKDPYIALEYLAAVPRMALYIDYSTRIYNIYLRYISPEDIHVYSIDEVFIDATDYLKLYHLSAHAFARKLINEVLNETGITATAGIAENMYLCKCAMDIVAKHIPADEDGVRIAEIDAYSYRKQLWAHRPLTDFWRVGKGIARKLESEGIYTMGDVARCSLGSFQDYYNEDLLYKMFGVNAETLIDHAWGYEPCTMKDIKAYEPSSHSLGIGQVLQRPYTYEEGKTIVKEMADQLSLQLIDKHLNTSEIVLTIGYDISSSDTYEGETSIDWYGRIIPKGAHGSYKFKKRTASSRLLRDACMHIYETKVSSTLSVRRFSIAALDTKDESFVSQSYEQTDLFSFTERNEKNEIDEEKEAKAAKAILQIQKKYGKNALIKGMDLQDEATTKERNRQIGGHKA